MNIMILRIEESVDACLEAVTAALVATPTQVIECTSIYEGTSPRAMLDHLAFIKACEILKPAVVFIHREHSLLEEQLADMASEMTDIQTQRDAIQQAFLAKEAELIARVKSTCPEYSHLQCFFTSGASLVAMACEVGDYQDFTEALDRFEREAGEAEEVRSSLEQARLNSDMRKISEAVSMDEGFISLRGKRK